MAAASVVVAGATFVAILIATAAGGWRIDVAVGADAGAPPRVRARRPGRRSMPCSPAGSATPVFAYGAAYLPRHLAHEDRPAAEARRFWPWMVLFMVAMVGLARALDLILLFVFFDLTAVASYFLIGFDRDRREARGAALMALLVTGISAVALLARRGAALRRSTGRSRCRSCSSAPHAGTTTAVACALIAVAALAKSAQVPLHFWLPRAMAAPTPVSAYLHSAAMVAAGRAGARPRAPAARARPGRARRAAGGRARLDRRRRRARARAGRAQADPRPLDDLPVRLRRGALRHRRRGGRRRGGVLRDRARDRQERAVHDRRAP